VTVKNGSAIIGSGALVGGQFSVSTTTLPVGADALSAVYSGDSNYQTHTVGLTQTVQSAGTNTILLSSANPSNPNQPITFTATVASNTTGTHRFGDVSGWNHNPRLFFVEWKRHRHVLDIHADYW